MRRNVCFLKRLNLMIDSWLAESKNFRPGRPQSFTVVWNARLSVARDSRARAVVRAYRAFENIGRAVKVQPDLNTRWNRNFRIKFFAGGLRFRVRNYWRTAYLVFAATCITDEREILGRAWKSNVPGSLGKCGDSLIIIRLIQNVIEYYRTM